MKQDAYVKSIVGKLKCSAKRKAEIGKELEADIQIALEREENWEQVERRMGSPAAVAKEFNDNFPESERKIARRNHRLKILAVIAVILLSAAALVWWWLPKNYPFGTESEWTEKEVITSAKLVVELLNENQFEELQAMSDEQMQEIVTQETMGSIRSQISTNWGEFQSFGNAYVGEMEQMGRSYILVELTALYDNLSVIYTISFNENLELAGIYMR